MAFFGRFYLDKEKDIVVDLFRDGDELRYVLRTPNHHTGNLITNLARLCQLPLSRDEQGLKVIEGPVPCYVDGDNRVLYVLRIGNTKIANIYPSGEIERKASIPAISKILMSQTKDYRLDVARTIVKTYIHADCKFRTDLHSHMNANLDPDILIALGIHHQIRYPLYYIKKLGLHCSPEQWRKLEERRARVASTFSDSNLTGKYRDRRIDDNTTINFARLILGNLADAADNIVRVRNSLTMPKDGQAVFANLEKLYLYRYVFTKGQPSEERISLEGLDRIPEPDVVNVLRQLEQDRQNPAYRDNTLFQDKLLWIARSYRNQGIRYAELSDTTLVKKDEAARMLGQVHAVMPAVTEETGVLLRFLAGIRRTPLTIVKDRITPNDYLTENIRVLRAVASDPYVAGSDILGEEINDILELRPVIRELVSIANEVPGFVIRIHAGENDSLRDNVANSVRLVLDSLAPGQKVPNIRIGHGLYATKSTTPIGKQLLQDLREHRVVLEFQLTSNVRLNNLSQLEHHPLRQYLRSGVRCVQGTDGSALYGTGSIDEELALEKLLGLSREDLRQMRRVEHEIEEDSFRCFAEKDAAFRSALNGQTPEAYLREQIRLAQATGSVLWLSDKRLNTAEELTDLIRELPEDRLPVIIAGGSFNSDRHRTRIRPENLALLDRLLEAGDPETMLFFIGHRLTAYEKYLVEKNKGRFAVYAFAPALISPSQRERLRRFGVSVRVSVEPSGMGLYKSIAYEIFKRRPSVLVAFDGNSAGANLVQEAKNGRVPCRIFIDARSRSLKAKAKSLQGYVTLFDSAADTAAAILEQTVREPAGQEK